MNDSNNKKNLKQVYVRRITKTEAQNYNSLNGGRNFEVSLKAYESFFGGNRIPGVATAVDATFHYRGHTLDATLSLGGGSNTPKITKKKNNGKKNKLGPEINSFKGLIGSQDYKPAEGDYITFLKVGNNEYNVTIIPQGEPLAQALVDWSQSIICIEENEGLDKENEGLDKENEGLDGGTDFYQKIFYGAPGTGKSHKLSKIARELFPETHFRVTLHPSYFYSNFVGCYKPFSCGDKITYEFVEGPLLKVLIEAILNRENKYLLIVEEINRADVASVFGEMFQLLDRNLDGVSEYDVVMSREVKCFVHHKIIDYVNRKYILNIAKDRIQDVRDLVLEKEGSPFIERLDSLLGKNWESIKFPNNFCIGATMNSADQGVKPMDAAFKRRWDLEYINIDEGVDENLKSFNFMIKENPERFISWNDFRQVINAELKRYVAEDQLLGPYFIPYSTLVKGSEMIKECIKNKVLMYLFEDVVSSNREQLFLRGGHKYTLYELMQMFEKDGCSIFNDNVSEALNDIIYREYSHEDTLDNDSENDLAEDVDKSE